MITMYYDSDCILCTTNAITMRQKAPDKIAIVPAFDALEILNAHGISKLDIMTYVVVQDELGQMHKGMNAVRLLYKTANVSFYQVLYLPIIKQMSDLIYPIIAKNRHKIPKWLIKIIYGKVAECDNGVCHISPKHRMNMGDK